MTESVELVCPHCQAINRVPKARLGDGPTCGKCSEPVLPRAPVNLTEQTMARFIEKNQLPVLVDFWAEWCGPCRMIAPILEELVQETGDLAVIAKLNIDENPEMPALLGIRSIPTLMLFKDGKTVGTKVGIHTKSALLEWIKSA